MRLPLPVQMWSVGTRRCQLSARPKYSETDRGDRDSAQISKALPASIEKGKSTPSSLKPSFTLLDVIAVELHEHHQGHGPQHEVSRSVTGSGMDLKNRLVHDLILHKLK